MLKKGKRGTTGQGVPQLKKSNEKKSGGQGQKKGRSERGTVYQFQLVAKRDGRNNTRISTKRGQRTVKKP